MDDNDDEFDLDFDLNGVLDAIEQAELQSKAPYQQGSNVNHMNMSTTNATSTTTTTATTNSNTEDEFADFDDDDFDVDALVQAVDRVEQQKATTTAVRPMAQSSLMSHFTPNPTRSATVRDARPSGSIARITFGLPEDMEDPTPPAPPPPDAKTYHPFDSQTLPTWIYPTNHPIRGYQFNIVRKALFSNTLVSIPTGLGKTFIAAVVMYNYYRWFPNSILIFMAPTRPLVEQQIKACYDVCGLPQKDTVIMVGTANKAKRPALWANGRVFFCTPQVVDNDLSNGTCPAHKVAMVVIDEAHKATGNYAYTNVIEKLGRIHSHFRILGLSATPGSTIDKVQTVVNNLRINTIQVRTEESMDVQEFSFGKRVQTVVIKLSYTTGATGIVPKTAATFCTQFFQPVLDRLHKNRAIFDPAPERCSPFRLLTDRQNYNSNAKNVPPAVKRKITVDFLLAEAFSRAYEGLSVYGVGTFVDTIERFLQGLRTTLEQGKNIPFEHQKILSHVGLQQLLDNLRQQLDTPGFVGHPKLDSLLNIILKHLNAAGHGTSTRIMVFSSLRASVTMIVHFLSVHHPMIRCAPFVGQAGDTDGIKGMNQKEQQQTIEKFKKGDINVIVATSIGEEGLDIGEVDLIVCYDSQNSSIRLLQRMGRTGRRRQGHCVMLMTETEERKYKKATDSYKYIQNMIASRNTIECCKETSDLLPASYQPVVQRKRLAIGHYNTTLVQGKKRKRQGTQFGKDGTLSVSGCEGFLATLGVDSLDQAYHRFWPVFDPLKGAQKYLLQNQKPTLTKRVGHSRRTDQFIALIKKMESRIGYRGLEDGSQSQRSMGDADDRVLKLPTRRNGGLILPRKKDKGKAVDATTCGLDDADWSSFMQPLITKGVDDDDGPAMMDFEFHDTLLDEPVGSPFGSGMDDDLLQYDEPKEVMDDMLQQQDVPEDDMTYQQVVPGNDTPRQQDSPEDDRLQQQNGPDDAMDDEFGSMDLDFLEQLVIDTPDHISHNTTTPVQPKVMFSFDDSLPPLPGSFACTTPSNFTTTFAWATTRPIYSDAAKRLLIKRLQQNNKLCLSVRLLGHPSTPPKSSSQMSFNFDDDDGDDIDIAALDELASQAMAKSRQHTNATRVKSAIGQEIANDMDNLAGEESQEWLITDDLIPQDASSGLNNVNSQIDPNQQENVNIIPKEGMSTGSSRADAFVVDDNSVDSWEINDDVIEANVTTGSDQLIHSTPIQQQEPDDDFINRAPYTLSPIDRTSTTPLRLFTPDQKQPYTPRVFTPVPIHLSSDTSHSSPIIRRHRVRRILDSDNDDDVPKRHVKPKQAVRYMDNPFLDTEAIRSDDDAATEDENEEDGDQSAMNSFICDGSSGLIPDGSSGLVLDDGNDDDRMGMAMYRTSLHQGSTTGAPVFSTYRRKTWLDKMSTDKWELAADEDDEEEEEEEDPTSTSIMEENISSFTNASDDFM